ncbi:MAG: DNA cytosine methyltransferase [Euryarchaeota archaeon]|nr:DNA cytosine methyltransferase [Euryarchaeota archaeon]
MTFSVVDLFAGAGGLSLGFKTAGFKVMSAVEANKYMTEAYHANLPDVKIQQKEVVDLVPESFMGVDVVVGAPPYEAFMATNKERRKEPRDRLYEDHHGETVLHFVDFIAASRPKAWLLELHPDAAEDDIMQSLGEEFAKAGSGQVYVTFLNAADFGATTDRVSLFLSNVPLEPEPPEEMGPPVGALMEETEEDENETSNHEIDTLPPEKLTKIQSLEPGDCLEPISLNGHDEVYPNWFRLIPEATAPPMYGFTRFVHPFEDRLCTVREFARLMGFPENFVFTGQRNLQFDAVGNAVPPPLARRVASEVGLALTQMQKNIA